MKAAFLTGVRRLDVRDIDEPAPPAEGQVLLAVESVGLCGSDMHYYRTGRIGDQVVQFPWIVGHEMAGRVLRVGPGVENLQVGQRVAVDPLIWCDACDQCRAGRRHTCRNQSFLGCPGQLPGCLSERIVMPASCCLPVPEGMSADQVALVEPLSIALWAQRLHGRATGQRVAVLGSGPVGLCVIAALKAAGRCWIAASDLHPERLRAAALCGADAAFPATNDDSPQPLDAQGEFQAVFECAGQQRTMDQATRLLTPGGKLVIVGIPESDRVSFSMDLLRRKELSVQNVRRQNECVADAVAAIAEGKIDLSPLLTHAFPLDQTPTAFAMVAEYRDGAIKVMVHP